MPLTLTDSQIRYAGRKILRYRPRPAADAFHRSMAKNRWLHGGNRCLGGEQEIYDPVAGAYRRVDSIKGPWHVWAWDGSKLVVAEAGEPFTKPPQQLSSLGLSNGQTLVCSETHRVLTSTRGWQAIRDLRGELIVSPVLTPTPRALIGTADRIREDTVWDFEVPDYHNYLAAGVINHNSGKSEANIGFDLCSFALGLHPHRRTPEGAVIWATANSWELCGKLLWQEKIRAYLPAGQIASIVWHNRGEGIPKELRLRNGVVIELKAYEQGRKAFEGRAVDAFYSDEQCKDDSENIWTEIQARLLDRGGFSAQSMTPILHQSWLVNRIRSLPATDEVFYADLNDNRKSRGGFVPDAEIDALIAQWPQEIRETRVKGYFAAFMGAVFQTFSRDVHVCNPFPIPDDWSRWRSIDFGFANPFVCLWLARDPDNRWYVYHEHYEARKSLAFHAERIKGISGRERYCCTWADHDSQDRFELETHGIRTTPARKAVHPGIEAVQAAALKVQDDGRPRLFVFDTCPHTIEETAGYKWAEGSETKDAKEEPLKVADHTVDALRYAVYGTDGPSYFTNCDLT